jgi:exopolysaccharide/PEP-CTERM locus tyrosine autokinase
MSRIEEALEKAAQLRGNQDDYIPAGTRFVPPGKHIPPPIQEDQLQVRNQLLVAANAPNTPVAEEYRKLKSILVQLTRAGELKNMLMVTSSVTSEGKSITSLNLALALAKEYDHTVLLIDADLRKPSIHTYLGMEQVVGLSECLNDEIDVKDALIKTGIGRLSLLPAGRKVRNPAEIFSSQKSKDFFLDIKNRYRDRFIIIDTPPVLPFSETRSMSSFVDGVVLVVKEGSVPLRSVSETLDCLKGSNILGIVYNDTGQEGHCASHHYYRSGYSTLS